MPQNSRQWVSITEEFAQYLVDNEKYILSRFRWSYCPDEVYKQTLIMASPFKDKIFDATVNAGSGTRLIDWVRGNPYIWRISDYKQLSEAKELFARKFDSRVDSMIIDAIRNHVKPHKQRTIIQ